MLQNRFRFISTAWLMVKHQKSKELCRLLDHAFTKCIFFTYHPHIYCAMITSFCMNINYHTSACLYKLEDYLQLNYGGRVMVIIIIEYNIVDMDGFLSVSSILSTNSWISHLTVFANLTIFYNIICNCK